ncbi:MAG TPA: PilZ domain-containing protein [Syntrophales bacterium]|nr:PilZ domain-containing protein [Syntrophales bacterium]
MPNVIDQVTQNKREFSRINAHFPLEIRLVPAEERQSIRSRAEGKGVPNVKLPPDVNDPVLAEWLKLLLAKIDAVLRLVSLSGEVDESSPYKTQNISGGGISFNSPESFTLGDIVEIKVPHTAILSQSLCLCGEVIKSEKQDDGWLTAVQFIFLDDTLRDEIVRFVFEREREILREKRGVR